MSRDIPNTCEIGAYMHCRVCLEELQVLGRTIGKTKTSEDYTPENYARLSIGWTKLGIQVWCVRHDINIVHVDFEGQKHPANVTMSGETDVSVRTSS